MYTLYHSKNEKALKISKAKKVFQHLNYTEEVMSYNDCYYICSQRKPLVEKAREIQSGWVEEVGRELEAIKNIKI